MQTVVLDEEKSFSQNSEHKKITKDQMYKISTEIIGKEGKPFCGYFGVAFLQDDKEIDRKVCWLDFSGEKKTKEIVFKATTEHIILIYRINEETPVKSRCSLEITPVNEITVEQTKQTQESYDKMDDYILPRPSELTIQQEEKVERNLVWVLGSPRGGTTWVGTQLLSYNTNIIDESEIGLHIGSTGGGFKQEIVRDIDLYSKDEEYFFSKTYEKTWMYFLRKLILNRIFAQFPDSLEKITVIKDPTGGMIADTISQCLPNCKIVLLLRDGRDVVDSTLAAFSKEGWMTKGLGSTPLCSKEKRLEFLEKWTRQWVKRTEIMMKTFDSHQKELCYLIKYEDLRQNTKDELKKLYEFIRVKISDEKMEQVIKKFTFETIPKEMKGEGKFYRSASPGKWKENLDQEEQTILNDIIKDTILAVGYSD